MCFLPQLGPFEDTVQYSQFPLHLWSPMPLPNCTGLWCPGVPLYNTTLINSPQILKICLFIKAFFSLMVCVNLSLSAIFHTCLYCSLNYKHVLLSSSLLPLMLFLLIHLKLIPLLSNFIVPCRYR